MANEFEVPTIETIKPKYTVPIVPLVFGKAVTLTMKIDTLVKYMNMIIELYDTIQANWEAYTDQEISKLRSELLSRIYYLQTQIDDVNLRIDQIGEDWDIKLKRQFDTLINILMYSQNLQNSQFDAKLSALYKTILSMLTYGFPVIDPTTQKTSTVQVALDNIYALINSRYSLTVAEYRSLQLSVADYSQKYVTVIVYRSYWKEELYEYFGTLYDPFTGKRTTVQLIVNKLASFHMESLTVLQYRNKNLTVADYSAMNLTFEAYKNGF